MVTSTANPYFDCCPIERTGSDLQSAKWRCPNGSN
jgi:hypothetical protein